jgi:hypothetical protein
MKAPSRAEFIEMVNQIESDYKKNMKSIEIRLRESNGVNSYKGYCSECWKEVHIDKDVIDDPSTSDHQCTGERDVTVLQLDCVAWEDNMKELHPIDYLESKGIEVVAYTGDQADYCAYIALRGDVSDLPDWFRPSGYRHEGKELI